MLQVQYFFSLDDYNPAAFHRRYYFLVTIFSFISPKRGSAGII